MRFVQSESTKRWVHRPENFIAIKPQERKQDLAFTVYGWPQDFEDIRPGFEIKPAQNSYSSFNIDCVEQIPDVMRVARRAWELSQNKRRRLLAGT